MEEVTRYTKVCSQCERPVADDAVFCKYCGFFQPIEDEEFEDLQSDKWLKVLMVFYSLDLVICTLVNFLDFFRGLRWLFITEVVLATLTVIFIAILWKDVKFLFEWKSFTIVKSLVYAVASVLFAIVVNVLVKWVNNSIFDQEVYYYRTFMHLDYPRVAMLTLVALFPAIFEELSYRGLILHSLLKLADQRQAILIAAFLFAIIHMSFISFFWLMPFAIWLGNVRYKEKTIWYGVLIHFCFNLTACLFEFYELKLLPFI